MSEGKANKFYYSRSSLAFSKRYISILNGSSANQVKVLETIISSIDMINFGSKGVTEKKFKDAYGNLREALDKRLNGYKVPTTKVLMKIGGYSGLRCTARIHIRLYHKAMRKDNSGMKTWKVFKRHELESMKKVNQFIDTGKYGDHRSSDYDDSDELPSENTDSDDDEDEYCLSTRKKASRVKIHKTEEGGKTFSVNVFGMDYVFEVKCKDEVSIIRGGKDKIFGHFVKDGDSSFSSDGKTGSDISGQSMECD